MTETQKFAHNLIKILRQREMPIGLLAEKVGMSRPGISRVIHNRSGITLERASRIARALGVNLSDLLQG